MNRKWLTCQKTAWFQTDPHLQSLESTVFGLFRFVRRNRSLVKRYGVIFTCKTTRAVHVEIAHSLDTDSFLLALRLFIARRGQVQELRSDNGTYFTSGERELQESIQAWNHDKIHEQMLQRNIKWSFSPPYGSHHGSFWQRCTRSIRRILHAILLEQTIDDEGPATLVCGVEKILNSPPITVVSQVSRDLEPLTPRHLLFLKSDTMMPPGVFQKTYFPGVDGRKFDIFQIFFGRGGLVNIFHFFEIAKNGCISAVITLLEILH